MVYSVNHQLLLLLRADLLRAFYYSFSHNAQSLFSFRLAVNIIQPRAIARRIQNGDTKSGCLLFFFFFFKKVRIWQGNTPTLSLSLSLNERRPCQMWRVKRFSRRVSTIKGLLPTNRPHLSPLTCSSFSKKKILFFRGGYFRGRHRMVFFLFFFGKRKHLGMFSPSAF